MDKWANLEATSSYGLMRDTGFKMGFLKASDVRLRTYPCIADNREEVARETSRHFAFGCQAMNLFLSITYVFIMSLTIYEFNN